MERQGPAREVVLRTAKVGILGDSLKRRDADGTELSTGNHGCQTKRKRHVESYCEKSSFENRS